jgi:hypothetical protein
MAGAQKNELSVAAAMNDCAPAFCLESGWKIL